MTLFKQLDQRPANPNARLRNTGPNSVARDDRHSVQWPQSAGAPAYIPGSAGMLRAQRHSGEWPLGLKASVFVFSVGLPAHEGVQRAFIFDLRDSALEGTVSGVRITEVAR
jgi:hypothetical protein